MTYWEFTVLWTLHMKKQMPGKGSKLTPDELAELEMAYADAVDEGQA